MITVRWEPSSIMVITLDRPDRRNAVDLPSLHAILAALDEAQRSDDPARVVVLTGAPPAFCAGADLNGVENDVFVGTLQSVLTRFTELPIPVIGAIDGPALGAGTQLASVCDLRVATSRSRFGIPAAKLGLAVDQWTANRVSQEFTPPIARAMLLAAETFDGERLHDAGVVHRIGGFDEAMSWAREVAGLAPMSPTETRRSSRRGTRRGGARMPRRVGPRSPRSDRPGSPGAERHRICGGPTPAFRPAVTVGPLCGHDRFVVGVDDAARRRFEAVFEANASLVLAYALRRTATPADAADVVSDTMLVAWRRIDDVPPGDQTRLWLYGVARRVLSNHRRGVRRRQRLGDRLRDVLVRDPSIGVDRAGFADVEFALERLPADDREVLRLTAWEGLNGNEVAIVLQISPNAARVRIHRARKRLRDVLHGTAAAAASIPSSRSAHD
jgi:enoyl-CoA hydratase